MSKNQIGQTGPWMKIFFSCKVYGIPTYPVPLNFTLKLELSFSHKISTHRKVSVDFLSIVIINQLVITAAFTIFVSGRERAPQGLTVIFVSPPGDIICLHCTF